MNWADRVSETTTTTGTGTLSLDGASDSSQRKFVDALGSGTSTDYLLVEGSQWEEGVGTVTAGTPDTFSRDTVYNSSNGGSKISLTGTTANLFCNIPARRLEGLIQDDVIYVKGSESVDDSIRIIVSSGVFKVQKRLSSTWTDLLNVDSGSGTDIARQLILSSALTPSQITSDQNDYNPSGLSSSSVLRLSSDATRTITGMAGGTGGRIVVIHNVGSNTIVLDHNSGSSMPYNKFHVDGLGGRDYVLPPSGSVVVQYDSSAAVWRTVAVSQFLITQTANGRTQGFQVTDSALSDRVYLSIYSSDVGCVAVSDGGGHKYLALQPDGGGVIVGGAGSLPSSKFEVAGEFGAQELSADPSDPPEGKFKIWMSDGTGSGDDGDIMIKITAGATTKTATLIDFSAV